LTHIYFKNNPAKFHPNPIQNAEALRFFGRQSPQEQEQKQQQQVPDTKIKTSFTNNSLPMLFAY